MLKNSPMGVMLCIAFVSCILGVWSAGGAAQLPDGRAYEVVSPPDKAGGSIGALATRTRAAADGSAVTFLSLTAFGDAQGTSIETEYMAERDSAPLTPGWATHAITPRQEPQTFVAVSNGVDTQYTSELSPDLSTGVVRAWSPLTEDPDVANVANLYLRRDLRDAGPGAYSLVSACPACAGTPLLWNIRRNQMPWMAGASSDFHHILFESVLNLTGNGSRVTKLYASDDGAVRLVGVVPPGTDAVCTGSGCELPATPGGSIAGLGATFPRYTPRVMSSDGTRVNFSAPTTANGSLNPGFTDLYQSDSLGTATTADDTTRKLNVSERVPVSSAQGAVYQTASVDGSRVFFTSPERLTNDAPGGAQHLYMWHAGDPNDEAQQLTVSASGGTFTLTFDGQTTPAIAADAPASAVRSALEGLSSIGGVGGTIDVGGGPGDDGGTTPYVITFGGTLGRRDLPLLSADATFLSGTAPTAAVAPWVAGGGHLTVIDHDGEPGTVADPDPPANVSGVIGASEDGSRVYFIAQGQLVAGAPLLQRSGRPGIYLWQDGRISYIGNFATLPDAEQDTPVGQGTGLSWEGPRLLSRVTPDGGAVLFKAVDGSGLTGYDHNTTGCGGQGDQPCTELYVYSANSGVLACASCNPSGARATADATTDAKNDEAGIAPGSAHQNHSLSDDGRRVFFSSAEALVPEDTNGKLDAYEYDVPTRTVHLISSGKSTANSYFLDASASGDDVFFVTRERLVGWDVDSSYDLYDARVGGGFPDPAAPPLPCNGSTCQGTLAGAPAAQATGSATYAGAGNARGRLARRHAARRGRACGRGRVRRKVHGKARCVRRAKAKRVRHHAARRAATERSAR